MSDDLLKELKALQRENERLKCFDVINGTPWRNWVPTFGGYSVAPTGGIYRYCLIGKLCIITISMPNGGTSDATSFTITAPFISKNTANHYCGAVLSYAVDNGVALTVAARASLGPNTTTINLYTNMASGTWTASGAKRVYFTLAYEVP